MAHFSGCLLLLDCHNKGIDFTSHSSQINRVGSFRCVFTLQTARLDYVRSGRGTEYKKNPLEINPSLARLSESADLEHMSSNYSDGSLLMGTEPATRSLRMLVNVTVTT